VSTAVPSHAPSAPNGHTANGRSAASAHTSLRFRRRGSRSAPRTTSVGEFDPDVLNGRQVYERNMYLAGQTSTLMARYVRVRGDLLLASSALTAEDTVTRQAALNCRDLLVAAKRELESRHPNLTVVVNLLGLAERSLVTLYSPEILQLRIHTLVKDLQSMHPVPVAEIAAIRYAQRGLDRSEPTHQRDAVETAVKDAITYVNGCAEQDLLEDDLQVSRLVRVRWYLGFAWLLLLAVIPVVSSVQTLDEAVVWPVLEVGRGQAVDLVFGALGLSIIGAVGGVVSGMLNVRDSRATMMDYRTSLKKLSLKPMVGAVAALVVYLFLSAHMISGIEITSSGTYVVLAFVAGFSERYFLAVLNAQVVKKPARDAAGAPPGQVTTPAPRVATNPS
jgi:hypothetical protein